MSSGSSLIRLLDKDLDLASLDLKDKCVLLRADLNVPLNSELQITSLNRIEAVLPTIELLTSKGAKVNGRM